MLTDDEAIVVTLGTIAAGRLGLTATQDSVDGALAKIHRVLPDALRRQVEALDRRSTSLPPRPAAHPCEASWRWCSQTQSAGAAACARGIARTRASARGAS